MAAYTPEATRRAESGFLSLAMAYRPKQPIECEIQLSLEFHMPRPKSMTKKLSAIVGLPHVKKPDLDNLSKLVIDSLNGVFWKDDSQIYSQSAIKFYSTTPGVTMVIKSGSVMGSVKQGVEKC
jgi:Holliday junction resolvase RusA-like endonuclease